MVGTSPSSRRSSPGGNMPQIKPEGFFLCRHPIPDGYTDAGRNCGQIFERNTESLRAHLGRHGARSTSRGRTSAPLRTWSTEGQATPPRAPTPSYYPPATVYTAASGNKTTPRGRSTPKAGSNAAESLEQGKKRSLSATSVSPPPARARQIARNGDRSLRDLLQLAIDHQVPEEATMLLYRKFGGIHMSAAVTLFSRAKTEERQAAEFDLTIKVLQEKFPLFEQNSLSVQQSGKGNPSATEPNKKGHDAPLNKSKEAKALALYQQLVSIQAEANFKKNIQPFWHYCLSSVGPAQQLVTTRAPGRQSIIHVLCTVSGSKGDERARKLREKPALGPVEFVRMLNAYEAGGNSKARLKRILGTASYENLSLCPAAQSFRKREAPSASGLTMHSLRFIHLCDELAPDALKSYI